MAVLWDVLLCRLVEIDWRFRGAYCLHHHGPDDYETTRRNVLEDSHLHTLRRENLKSHQNKTFYTHKPILYSYIA
jgi:hypothetical protein